ncbi:MAG: YafY family transcriptional regulator [Spirochaetales bacterium]|nr:YafY family transcriptional regulator [Spirochaetales bacterium]
MRLDRLLSLYVMLLNRKKISALDLAREFQVSVRTIYRDMGALETAGLPVTSYPGPQGGFGFIEGYHIDRQVLSFQDILAILSALKVMGSTLANKEIYQVLEKVKTLVPFEKTPGIDGWSKRFGVDMLPWGRESDFKSRLNLIQTALFENRQLEIVYLNGQGEENRRVIDIYHLHFKAYSWYIMAYCHLRKDIRYFKLSRIKEVKPLDSYFEYNEKLASKQENDSGESSFIPLKLHFSSIVKARVYDCFPIKDIHEQDDASVIVETLGDMSESSLSFFLGFGEQLEVLEPEELKEKMAEKVQKLIALYAKSAVSD